MRQGAQMKLPAAAYNLLLDTCTRVRSWPPPFLPSSPPPTRPLAVSLLCTLTLQTGAAEGS